MFLSTMKTNEKVLSNVNLEVKPGDYVALCVALWSWKDYSFAV